MNLYGQLIKDYDQELTHSGVNGERLASRLDELSRIGLLDIIVFSSRLEEASNIKINME